MHGPSVHIIRIIVISVGVQSLPFKALPVDLSGRSPSGFVFCMVDMMNCVLLSILIGLWPYIHCRYAFGIDLSLMREWGQGQNQK